MSNQCCVVINGFLNIIGLSRLRETVKLCDNKTINYKSCNTKKGKHVPDNKSVLCVARYELYNAYVSYVFVADRLSILLAVAI